ASPADNPSGKAAWRLEYDADIGALSLGTRRPNPYFLDNLVTRQTKIGIEEWHSLIKRAQARLRLQLSA
ncbi:MAG: hypothetical protein AAFY51_13000, partial [Pseudomonadota bacterium]